LGFEYPEKRTLYMIFPGTPRKAARHCRLKWRDMEKGVVRREERMEGTKKQIIVFAVRSQGPLAETPRVCLDQAEPT